MARYASIGVAILSIILALFAQTLNVAFLVSLAFAVAAECKSTSDFIYNILEAF